MREDGGGRRVMSNRSALEMSLNIRIKWDMQEKRHGQQVYNGKR